MGRSISAIIVVATLCATHAHASAWTRQDGRLFVATKLQYFSSDQGPQATFKRFDTSTYAEFGLFRRFAVGAKVDYGTSWIGDLDGVVVASGFSEIESFGQRELWRRARDVAAMRLGVIAPARIGSGVRSGIASDGLSLEARALYGRNIFLRPMKVFASVEAGFRKNIGVGADEIRTDMTIGAEPLNRFLLLVEAFAVTSLQNEDAGGSDYDSYRGQISFVWSIAKRWRIQGGYNREFDGRNIALGKSVILGLWSEF